MTSAFNFGKYSEEPVSQFILAPAETFILTLDDWGDPVDSKYVHGDEVQKRVNLRFKVDSDPKGGDPVDDDDRSVKGAEAAMWVNLNLNPNDKQSIWHVLVALDPDTEPKPGGSIEPYRGKKMKGTIVHSKGKKDPTKTFADVINPKAVPARLRQKAVNPLVDEDSDE